jgi:hypothetical protein
MKYTIYEHPDTHHFAMIRLPVKFAQGDAIPLPSSIRWFSTREEVVANLSGLFDDEDAGANSLGEGDESIPH